MMLKVRLIPLENIEMLRPKRYSPSMAQRQDAPVFTNGPIKSSMWELEMGRNDRFRGVLLPIVSRRYLLEVR